MSSIIELIRPERSKLSALEFRKFAIFDFVYTLASANIDQSAPKLATICLSIRSLMSSIMGEIEPEHPELWISSMKELIRPELSELSAFELENLPYLTLFTL